MSTFNQEPVDGFSVRPQTPTRRHRNRASLEHVLIFTLASPVPTEREVHEATFIYHMIIDSCKDSGAVLLGSSTFSEIGLGLGLSDVTPPLAHASSSDSQPLQINTEPRNPTNKDVHLHRFFKGLYDHSPTDAGRVNLVRMILHGLFSPRETTADLRSLERILPCARRWSCFTHAERIEIFTSLAHIASDLLTGFFLPLKAQGGNTASVSTLLTPPTAAHVGPGQGTPNRLRNLRQLVLRRDGHRCVVTGLYDKKYILSEQSANRTPPAAFGLKTETAHIIPHSLNAVSAAGDPLDASKGFVWSILNMFDPGVASRLEGTQIDSPENTLLLVSDIHDEFGKLHCYFEEVPGTPNTYAFKTVRGATALPPFLQPQSQTITFANQEPAGELCSALPSKRLLKLHAACCIMLAMAGAAEYVEKLIDDAEELQCRGTLAADGSSEIGIFLGMRGVQSIMDGDDQRRGEHVLRNRLAA